MWIAVVATQSIFINCQLQFGVTYMRSTGIYPISSVISWKEGSANRALAEIVESVHYKDYTMCVLVWLSVHENYIVLYTCAILKVLLLTQRVR